MEPDKIFYYDGLSARPKEVRVLIFQDLLNIYEEQTNNFLGSYSLNACRLNRTVSQYFIYLNNSGSPYLEMHEKHEMAETLHNEVMEANNGWLQKLMKQKVFLLLGVMVALIVGVYILFITLIPAIGSAVINRSTEIAMGNQLKEVMLREELLMGSKVDTPGTARLQKFADLVNLSEEYRIQVTLMESDLVNAYAMPGGHVVIYTGMLEKLEDPESLVALLAHEASHINHRHTLKSLLRSAADGIVLSVIFNDASGATATIVSNAQSLRGLEYSRSLEKEADESGMLLMVKNRVNALGMRKLMQVLEKEPDIPSQISFLSTHPLTKKRIEAADAFIQKHPYQKTVDPRLMAAFQALKK